MPRVHKENYGVYGVRKMHAELNRRGHRIARCTVHRLMRADGLRGISRAKGPRTTVPGSGPDARPDLLGPGTSRHRRRTGSGSRSSPTTAPSPDGSTPRSSSTSSPAGSWAGSCRRVCVPTWRWMPSRWGCGPASTLATTPPASLHTATRECSTSPCATPSDSPRPAQSRQSGRRATATTTPWPRHSLAVQGRAGPQQEAVEEHRRPRDRGRGVHRLAPPPAPARRDRARPTRRVRERLLPAQPRADHRQRVSSEPLLNTARDNRDRSCVHVEPNACALGKNRGLPQLLDRPSRAALLGNPRPFVSGAPVYNPQQPLSGHSHTGYLVGCSSLRVITAWSALNGRSITVNSTI